MNFNNVVFFKPSLTPTLEFELNGCYQDKIEQLISSFCTLINTYLTRSDPSFLMRTLGQLDLVEAVRFSIMQFRSFKQAFFILPSKMHNPV